MSKGIYIKTDASEVTPENVCTDCPWATRVTDNKVYCMFISGSCARIKGSLETPVKAKLRNSIEVASEVRWASRLRFNQLVKLAREAGKEDKKDDKKTKSD